MRVEVHGVQLPGRSLDGYDGVQAGLRVGSELAGVVPGDAGDVVWRTEVRVREVDGSFDVTGEAVRGRRGDRALALAWLDGEGELFRAAKLRLDRVAADVVAEAMCDGLALVGTVRLTDDCGGPVCASVPASHISWTAAPAGG